MNPETDDTQDHGATRTDLERENAALRKQVDALMRQLAPPPPPPRPEPTSDARETCYLIAIPPAAERTQAIVSLARKAVEFVRKQIPERDWQVIHRLEDLPLDGNAVQLGDFMQAAFGGRREIHWYCRDGNTLRFAPTPAQLGRVEGEARRLVDRIDALMREAEAAYYAGYHARTVGYGMVADMLLAHLTVMVAQFTAGLEWKTADGALTSADEHRATLDAKTPV